MRSKLRTWPKHNYLRRKNIGLGIKKNPLKRNLCIQYCIIWEEFFYLRRSTTPGFVTDFDKLSIVRGRIFKTLLVRVIWRFLCRFCLFHAFLVLLSQRRSVEFVQREEKYIFWAGNSLLNRSKAAAFSSCSSSLVDIFMWIAYKILFFLEFPRFIWTAECDSSIKEISSASDPLIAEPSVCNEPLVSRLLCIG